MAQQVKGLLPKSDDLSSIPRTHEKVDCLGDKKKISAYSLGYLRFHFSQTALESGKSPASFFEVLGIPGKQFVFCFVFVFFFYPRRNLMMLPWPDCSSWVKAILLPQPPNPSESLFSSFFFLKQGFSVQSYLL